MVGSRLIMSSVLIADDHAVVRAGYRQFLGTEPNITRIGEAADGAEVIRRLQSELWDLVMLDIHMPDRSGLDVLHHIRVEHPAVRVLIVSGLREDQYARNVLRAGASGYVSKSDAPEDMMLAVRTVLSGRRYVSRTLAELLVSDLDGAADEPLHTRLSSREFQIFCKIAAGVGVSKIAEELSLSVKTISTYRSRIMEKLTFNSNADMTAYALRNELIQ
jgi:DNA-binding NarL/FixJ family response regulator